MPAPGAARNHAISLAQGTWLAFLDSDDLWLPWTLPILIETLSAAPASVDLVFGLNQEFADPAELPAPVTAAALPPAARLERAENYAAAMRRHPTFKFSTCNAVIRRRTALALEGFAPELRCSEDHDLFLRVPGEVMMITAPVMLGLRRAGHDSLTGNVADLAHGVEWLRRQDEAGRYLGAAADRRGLIAVSCAYGIRVAFATGHPGAAYRLYARHAALLRHPRTRGHLLRLPFTPLLHLLRPRNHPFRLRPVNRPASAARG